MAQESLKSYIEPLERNGLLRRYTDEKRVDELPRLMEDNPDVAILVERAKDCAFPFFANGYGSREMYALALDCDTKRVGREIVRRAAAHYRAQLVETAPCKEVIVRGEQVDITVLPLFNHHPRAGQPYLNAQARGLM